MPKQKTRPKAEKAEREEPLSPAEQEAVRRAGRLGLYVLFEYAGWKRSWRVYSRSDGKPVLTYYPSSAKYIGHRPGLPDGTADWGDALNLAGDAVARPR